MNINAPSRWLLLIGLAASSAGCASWKFTHVPPGQSVELALAKRATEVEHPISKTTHPAQALPPEPARTAGNMDGIATVSDYYTLGCLFMQQANYTDAAGAFENALKLDPSYSEAWNNLAICYQNTGQQEKAIETFRKYKQLSTR